MRDLQKRTKDLDRSDLAAKAVDFSEIPLIDIAGLRSADPAERQRVADEIGKACREVGFLYVTNHGISPDLVSSTYGALARFFDRPMEEKMRLDINALARHRGYVPFGGLNADPHTPGTDIQEALEIGLELPEDDPDYRAGNMMYGPNVWPDNPADFRDIVYRYFEEVRGLGHLLFRGFALTLGMPEDWFEDKITKPMGQLRALHYPPQPGRVENPKEIGIGAHTDYECFTILSASSGGLQVRNRAGEWIGAPPIPDAFVINIGDIMERWTNGEFISTIHRVINTTGAERYSLAYFFGANYDTVVECLPTCCGPDRPAQYPPVTAGEWTTENIMAAYAYRPAMEARG